jgi:uncharacterized protein
MDHYSALLGDLHTYLLRVRDVTQELEEGPKRLKRLQNKVSAAEKALADHLNAIKALKVSIHDHEVSLKANSEKIKKHKRDLEGNVSKKEYDALNVEIASLEKRNSDLEDEGLELMTQAEEQAGKTPVFEAAVTKAKSDFSKAEAEYKEQLPSWQTRLAEAQASVKEKSALLPEEWQKPYQRLVTNEGADALASLNGKACSACQLDVTAQQYAMLSAGRIEACKSCGKLLYQTYLNVV